MPCSEFCFLLSFSSVKINTQVVQIYEVSIDFYLQEELCWHWFSVLSLVGRSKWDKNTTSEVKREIGTYKLWHFAKYSVDSLHWLLFHQNHD